MNEETPTPTRRGRLRPLLVEASEMNNRLDWSLRERGTFPTYDDLAALRDEAYLRKESSNG